MAIDDISLDDADPADMRPMAIRAGGVDFIFSSSFLQDFDLTTWEKFGGDLEGGGGSTIIYAKRHYFNAEYKFNGAVKFSTQNIEEAL